MMSFLIRFPPDASIGERDARWKAYRRFLDGERKRMPALAFEFAAADWHYDFNDHRCPHDAWVNSVAVVENASGERHEVRSLEIRIELLGAYHDGTIRITYPGVTRYSLYQPWDRQQGLPSSHGDWLVDEVSPARNSRPERRLVEHEILFATGASWTIEAEDIRYEWRPDKPDQAEEVGQRMDCAWCEIERSSKKRLEPAEPRVCPICDHVFRGAGWDGIDAHWKATHERGGMPYEEFWAGLVACTRHHPG